MTKGAKMLLMAREEGNDRQMNRRGDNYPRNGENGSRMNYDRNDGDNTRMNYPRMGYTSYSAYPEWGASNYGDTEARFRDRRGREHYDNGRFAPRNAMEWTGADDRRYAAEIPPIYRGDNMNRIGFVTEPSREMERRYPMDVEYPRMEEMGHHTSEMAMGHAKGGEMMLTEEMAGEWMHNIHNEDGTKGAHWTKEQVKQVMSQHGIKQPLLDFWVVMNSLYADYCSVFKKHNTNNLDFYVDMATAWLNDKDAQEGKAARYFQYIAK